MCERERERPVHNEWGGDQKVACDVDDDNNLLFFREARVSESFIVN